MGRGTKNAIKMASKFVYDTSKPDSKEFVALKRCMDRAPVCVSLAPGFHLVTLALL